MVALPTKAEIEQSENKTLKKPRLGNIPAFIAQLPGAAAETELTVAAGTVTPNRYLHRVDTESDAAADNLDNILLDNLPDGSRIRLRAENAARIVTLRHQQGGDGEIVLTNGEACALDDAGKWIILERRGTQWVEVLRSTVFGRRVGTAADAAAARTLLGLGALAVKTTVVEGDIGSGAVTTAKLGDAAVTTVKLADANVTKAKFENVTADRLLGRGNGSAGAPQEIALGAGLALAGTTLNATLVKAALLQDQKADGTHGGNSTGSSTWDKRALNTEVFDAAGFVSLPGSDVFRLIAGKYLIHALPTIIGTGGADIAWRGRIRNETAGADAALSPSWRAAVANVAITCTLPMWAYADIAGDTDFAVYTASSGAVGNGLGLHDNMTLGVEIYTQVLIWKLA